MRKTTGIVAALAAAGLAAGAVVPAAAAPSSKGTTYVVPSAITASVLQGVAKPGSLGDMGAAFGIVGNPSSGVIKHVGGLFVYSPASDSTLELRNFWIDTEEGVVSGVVNDSFRADLFEVDGAGVLTFTSTASNAIVGSDAIAGAEAGTATVDMP
jgi:hypothetical protein